MNTLHLPRTIRVVLSLSWILLICSVEAVGQFAYSYGSVGQEYGKAITVDSKGNSIAAILFQNSIDFDLGPEVVLLGTPPGVDLAIVKHNRSGELLWARSVSGAGGSVVTPHGIAVDGSDNIYVIGYFGVRDGAATAADFDPGTGVATLTNSGGWDPMIVKYDSNGNYLWGRTIGNTIPSTSEERAWDLAVDPEGNVYVTGFVNGTYDLDADPVAENVYVCAGASDAFLVKYDNQGNHLWGIGLGGSGADDGLSVALDGEGHIFLEGHFSGTVDFDPGAANASLTSSGGTDVFIARFSTDGSFQKAIRLGGTLPETSPPGAMRADDDGNIYMTGRFRGNIDLDPGAGTRAIANTGAGVTDEIFLATYSGDLAFRWGFNIVSDGGLDGAHRVAIDRDANIYITGWFSGTTDFDGSSGTHTLSSANPTNSASDVFLARYDNEGNFLWASGFGGVVSDPAQLSIAAGLAIDPFDNSAYITGQYFGIADYDPSSAQVMLSSVGLNDAFIARYDTSGNLWQEPAMPPSLAVTPTQYDFGSVTVGDNKAMTFNIKGSNLTSDLLLSVPTGYTMEYNGVVDLPTLALSRDAGSSVDAEIIVRFTPIATMAYSGVMSITGNAVGATVALNGVGESTVASAEQGRFPKFQIISFPNPGSEDITFSFDLPEANPVTVELFNATGRRVMAIDRGTLGAGTHLMHVDLATLAPGCYLCVLHAGEQITTGQIVVQR